MYNWNTNTTKWNKTSDTYQVWQLEQMINFGLNGNKLDLVQVKKYWMDLKLDKYRQKFLELILWPERY
jgi:hypothetical protein